MSSATAEQTVKKIITVDGPAGSGKGTLAQALANELGMVYVESGAFYRHLALRIIGANLSPDDIKITETKGYGGVDLSKYMGVFETITADTVLAMAQDLMWTYSENVNTAHLSPIIRQDCIASGASVIATFPVAQRAMQQMLHTAAHCFEFGPTQSGMVVDGRDMGIHVFPDAVAKLWVTADAATRAGRRLDQYREAGKIVLLSTVYRSIVERDQRDANRASFPMKPASDALIIDTSNLTPEQTLQQALTHCRTVMDTVFPKGFSRKQGMPVARRV